MTLVAGVDCSTQATRVVIIDLDDGRMVATGRALHEVDTFTAPRETDPRLWRAALATTLSQTGRAEEISAIAVAAQQHGLVVACPDAEPLRPALLWNDTRSAPQARELVDGLRWTGMVGQGDRRRAPSVHQHHEVGLAA